MAFYITMVIRPQVQYGSGLLTGMQKSVFLALWDTYDAYDCDILHTESISAIKSENLDFMSFT